ncbi:MAG: glycosyltransferase [Azoarcus sp.]|jgi:glycosyltransferase involved in cell wall biosynthesis/peptidoglycan/xylan/chitin deacetylase (PgdA/CDA1 family)|nr:glycosyltransferase [Azoarcus sp.]
MSTHVVLIPSYNPGAKVVDTVRAACAQWESVWVVVDGSTDGSADVLRALAAATQGLEVFVLPQNQGKGAAVLHGLDIAAARGVTHVLTMDSDGQHPAELIPRFMAASRATPAAMILGRPLFDASAPRLRVRGRKVSNAWANLETLWAGIGDSLYGFRVYPVEALRAVMRGQRWMRRFDFDPEAAVRLAWRGVPAVNLDAPVKYFAAAEGGVSHFNYLRDNLLLTWMHSRLLLEFVLRLPWLAWRKMKAARIGPGFSIPVLCYHSFNVSGQRYETNDHLALEADLEMLGQRGYQLVSLPDLVDILRGERPAPGLKLVALSCDDGVDLDWHDAHHECGGHLLAFHTLLEQSRQCLPQWGEGPRAVAFVIASPEARAAMEQACAGHPTLREDWWAECAAQGVLGIANHSWDHVHDCLTVVCQRDNKKGSFLDIATPSEADGQIARAQAYIDEKTAGKALPLFAYPYGHVSPWLRDEYFPAQEKSSGGLRAAFGTGGMSVRPGSNIWALPRFVCGEHWRNPEEFAALLDAVERGEK